MKIRIRVTPLRVTIQEGKKINFFSWSVAVGYAKQKLSKDDQKILHSLLKREGITQKEIDDAIEADAVLIAEAKALF